MKLGRIGGCIAFLTLLAGCQTDQQAAAPMTPPDYKALILANRNRLWKDADSIKNASVAAPRRSTGILPMWHVCVRSNAKNAFGGYTGEKDMLIGIYDDNQPPSVVMADGGGYCDHPHEPFPELNGDYKPPASKPKA